MNTRRAGLLLAALVVLFALATPWWLGTRPAPVDVPAAPAPPPPASPAATTSPPERTAADAPADAPAAFTSTDADGNVFADAVRDGITLVVREADGSPCADTALGLNWHKGDEHYGWDRGRTAADGTFVSTVHDVIEIESVEIEHPRFGKLEHAGTPEAAVDGPRRVVYMLPPIANVRLHVVDLADVPVTDARVGVYNSSPVPAPRVMLLLPRPEPVSDRDGDVVVRLAVGEATFAARIGDDDAAQWVVTRVLPEGGTIVMRVVRPEQRLDVEVDVVLPEGIARTSYLTAASDQPLPLPPSPLVLRCDPSTREFPLQQREPGVYTTRVDPLPWRLLVGAPKCEPLTIEVPPQQRRVRAVLRRAAPSGDAAPRARVHGHVLDPDGRPAVEAKVRVHDTPDFVQGTLLDVDGEGRFAFTRPPGGRICLSADERFRLPPVVVGPIELVAGDQDVTLRLESARALDGIVVDAAGKPVACTVRLHRPAGALASLREGVPAILDAAGPGDTLAVADGRFHFAAVGSGEHELWAIPTAGGWPARQRVRGGGEVTLRLGEGTEGMVAWSLRVVDADSGAVLPEVDVDVDGAITGVKRGGPGEPFTVVVRPGERRVRAQARDHVVGRAVVRVDGPGTPCLEVRLAASPVRFVRVVEAAGASVPEARVGGIGTDGEAIELLDVGGHTLGAVLATDRHGRADLRGLPAGPVRLRVQVGGQKRDFELPADGGIDRLFELVWTR